MNNTTLKEYKVWDLPTRLFHWINFLSVISLIFVGLLMMYKKDLGITSLEAKVGLKELHVTIGYVFATNLVWRIIWGFIGNRFARWSTILPGKGYGAVLQSYKASLKAGEPQQFLGHNPLGRLAVSVIVLLLFVMMVSGLIRAGTDVYYPPFGGFAASYVAAPGTDPATIEPYDATGTDAERLAALKAFKGPFGEVHFYTAYTLMFLIVLHIFFVIRTESREGGSLISAMFNGRKVLSRPPVDGD
jgi:cytochrome b